MNQTIDQVLDSVVSTVTALGLLVNGQPIPVIKRKLPTKEETLDPPTQLVVCMAEGVPAPVRFCQGVLSFRLPVEVVLVSPSPGDRLRSIPLLSDVYGQVRGAFARTSKTKGDHPVTLPAGSGASVHRVEPAEGTFLDRPKLNAAFDYQAQTVNVWLLALTR